MSHQVALQLSLDKATGRCIYCGSNHDSFWCAPEELKREYRKLLTPTAAPARGEGET